MKKLILVRHAKSSWKHNVSDIDRPLKSRGIEDTVIVSSAFKPKAMVIDFVFSSPANRALTTCNLFRQYLSITATKSKIVEELYDFEGEGVINFIKTVDDKLDTIMLFGHNHAFTSILNSFGDKYLDNLPTSGLVVIAFNIESWKYIKHGHTETIILPRDFKS